MASMAFLALALSTTRSMHATPRRVLSSGHHRTRVALAVAAPDSQPSAEDIASYLARNPDFAVALQSALHHAVSTNEPDPGRTIATRLSQTQRIMPPPSQCPRRGVQRSTTVSRRKVYAWLFQWNHFVNIEFFNEQMLGDVQTWDVPQVAYPVRMLASAG